jgi:hypothetical protein
MGDLTADQVGALNVALNEATLVGVEMDAAHRRFGVTLAVLSLPEDGGPPPDDPRIKLVLEPVGRLAVSWRQATWDDDRAEPLPLALDQLPSVVADFGQLPIYGWEFLDTGAPSFADRPSRLSLDLDLGPERAHTLDLFQDGNVQFLELRAWFARLTIGRPVGDRLEPVPIDDVAAAGQRWWDALAAGDARTSAAGIFPLRSDTPPNGQPPDSG